MVSKKKKSRKLTVRQKKFAKYYAATGNGTQSAKKAGYSKKAAGVVAHETLQNPNVKKAIHEALEESLAKAQLKSDHVIEQLRRIAFADIGEAYLPNGQLKHPMEMDEITRAAVQSIEIDEITVAGGFKIGDKKKLKLADKIKALELIGKSFGIFKDVLETDNTHTIDATDEQVNASFEKFKAGL
jgi:phage terminase small subunit